MPFYAVRVGKTPGIYNTWDECKTQVMGFKGAIYKKFMKQSDAQKFTENISTTYDKKASKSYTRKKKKKGANKVYVKKPNTLYIFTDGSSVGNGSSDSIAGYGIYIPEPFEYQIKMRGSLPKGTTNNYAELKAILDALRLHDYNEVRHNSQNTENPIDYIVITTDSEYSMNCIIKWAAKWERNGWRSSQGGQVKNKGLIQQIWKLYKEYKPEFLHINSHTGKRGFFYEGNQVADDLAGGVSK
jgi:ribonuclease HI